ncbi:MAG: hypothetical protein ACFFDO_00180 [Candidatus Thorarchaeota archaeon]
MSFKKMMGSITDKLKISGGVIRDAIKQNKEYIDAELRVIKMAQEGINALKSYAEAETPSLKTSVNALAQKLENKEKAREEMANQLQEKFINLLNEILDEERNLSEKLKLADDAQKDLAKAENKLAKLESKPKEKLKPEQIDEAKSALKEADGTYREAEAKANAADNAYNKKKLDLMKSILKNIEDIERAFHDKALKQIGAKKEVAISV